MTALTHQMSEDTPWTISVGDHAARADSPTYSRSRKLMIKAVQAAGRPWFFGDPPYQDHHGGGVWVWGHDEKPYLFLLPAGIEWSSQFCADPAKVEVLRAMAEQLVAAFPATEDWYRKIGMTATDLKILHTPITDDKGVGLWTDSFWNACVPLPQPIHTGTLPGGSGYHHYPKPIVDITLFKRDDFSLFVNDKDGHPLALAPVAPRGSGDARTRVLWAHPDSSLHAKHQKAHAKDEALILPAGSLLSKRAYANQKD